VTWVLNQNHCHHICVNACGFCGFSEAGESVSTLRKRSSGARRQAKKAGIHEICTSAAWHPDFTAESYTDTYRGSKKLMPPGCTSSIEPNGGGICGTKERNLTEEVLHRMKEQVWLDGRDCCRDPCGSVRKMICPEDPVRRNGSGSSRGGIQWTPHHRIDHVRLRTDRRVRISNSFGNLDRSGITEFVPLSFILMEQSPVPEGRARAGRPPAGRFLMVVVSRRVSRQFPDVWCRGSRTREACPALAHGRANDLGGTCSRSDLEGAGHKIRLPRSPR
jgi:2-iminoacetate synthase ThiH